MGRCGARSLAPVRTSFLRRAGFTLVEIMIAIGLLSLVIAAIYSTWTAILRASKVGLDAAATAQRSRIAVRVLEDSLASAQAFASHMQLHPEYYSFIGDEKSLSFVARLAPSFPRSGKFGDFDVRRLTFSVEDAHDGGQDLVLRQNALLIDMDSDEQDHPLVLARHVDKFELNFWDQRKNEWVDNWTDDFTNQLPPLVKVTLTLKNHPNSIKASQHIVRVISIPSVTIAPSWQMPNLPGMPPPPAGGPPGAPPPPPGGMLPGQLPVGFVNQQ